MIDISKSTLSSIFPLELFKDRCEVNSSGYHWVKLIYLIFGITDLRARSGTFTTPWNAVSPYRVPLPDLSIPETKSLSDIMDEQAIATYNTAKKLNKKILVMWSGGIDSTAVLVSLLKNIPTNEQKDMIVICMSPDSALENLFFYKNFISNKFQIMHRLMLNLNEQVLKQYLILHGDPGDALFGPSSGKYSHLVADNRHLLPYKDNANLLYDCISVHGLFPFESSKWIVDKINANLDEVQPENVKTIADWFWWQYVNFKWEGSLWRPFVGTGVRNDFTQPISEQQTKEYIDNVFFGTDAFQRWSYNNLHRLFPEGMSSHKQDAKQYIFDFDHNDCYATYKSKTASIGVHVSNGLERNHWTRPVFFDKDWVGHTMQDPDVYNQTLELLLAYKG